MSTITMRIWGAVALLYLVFFLWYTNLSGALTAEEIETHLATMAEIGYTQDQLDGIRMFMESDDGGDFYMVNLIKYNETPPVLSVTGEGATGADLMDYYMEYMTPALISRASHPVYYSTTFYRSMEVVGIENALSWDIIAIMRYRSRRDIVEIVANPLFRERHEYKVGALEKTIATPTIINFFVDFRLVVFFVLFFLTALLVSLVAHLRARHGYRTAPETPPAPNRQ